MTEVFFNGTAGRIEGRYIESKNNAAPIALVLHSHSLYGGNMNNKVVRTMFDSFVHNGFSVLRINFRGVGRSQGTFDEGIGEMFDAAAALDWLQVQNPYSNFNVIAGFSFGSWIAMQLIMRRPEINYFISVSPPVHKYDFSFLTPCPISGLIIQGDNDSIVCENDVLNLANRLSRQKHISIDCKLVNNADHFFRDKTDELKGIVDEYLACIKVPLQNIKSQTVIDNIDEYDESNQKVFID